MFTSFAYQKSPARVQDWMLSLRGLVRSQLREGPGFEQVFREIGRTGQMSASELERFQLETLKKLLLHAGKKVPYYRQGFSSSGFDPARLETLAQLEALPILYKQDVANAGSAMLAEGHRSLKIKGHTGGTTGSPLNLYQDLAAIRREHAFIWRQMKWAGCSRGDRRVWFRGELVVPTGVRTPPFWRFDAAENMLMMSSYHLSEESCRAYVEALVEFDPVLIQAYPSSIAFVARWLWNRGATIRIPSLKGVLTSSETLTDEQREHIESVFGVQVFDWYGSSERVAAIGTCEHSRYHVMSDYGLAEFIPDGDGAYQIVGTGFGNFLMPLVRYAAGDVVVPAEPGERCACGRAFPLVRRILGRQDDAIKTPDGRQVQSCLHGNVFKHVPGVAEAQIVQERLSAVDVRVVPSGELTEAARRQILTRMRERLGDEMEITVTEVPEIARTRNGKLRSVVCRV